MHVLQPKHSLLKPNEVSELFEKYNISASQLPKIKASDPSIPEGCASGGIIKIERKFGDKTFTYFRVVV